MRTSASSSPAARRRSVGLRQAGRAAVLAAVLTGIAAASATSAAAADACSNGDLRAGLSANLPDCRGYELASPADKAGGMVFGGPDFNEPATAQADPLGGGIAFDGSTAFPGTGSPSASLLTSYIGSRTDDGWTTAGTSLPLVVADTTGASAHLMVSDDLSKVVVSTNGDPATGQPSARLNGNFYWRDRATGVDELINKDVVSGSPAYSTTLVAATPSLGDVFFETTAVLVSGAPVSGVKLYRFNGASDTVTLASRLPNGNPVAGRNGSQLGGPQALQHTISDDASVVFFTAASGTAALYRRAGSVTTTINASENTNEVVALGVAQFRGASADGSRVYFTSSQRLLAADTNAVGDLYLWQRQHDSETQSVTVNATGGTFTLSLGGLTTSALPFNASAAAVQSALAALATVGAGDVTVSGGPGDGTGSTPYVVTFGGDLAGIDVAQMTSSAALLTGGTATATVATTHPVTNLTLVSADQEPADGSGCNISVTTATTTGGVLGLSDDGLRVYFACPGQLVSGAQTGTVPPLKLYYWDGSGDVPQLRYVAALTSEANPAWAISGIAASAGYQFRKITPDGRHLLFVSSAPGLTAEDNGGLRQVYLVSPDPGSGQTEVTCVSCSADGPATAESKLQEPPAKDGMMFTSRRNLSDDGQRVFFETDQPLVAGDTNGVRDVYEWEDGQLRRLSQGDHSSSFADASRSGDDAFVFTANRLVQADRDAAVDLYDVRVGGGTREIEQSPACSQDTCQGPVTGPPDKPALGSMRFDGPGDVLDPLVPLPRPPSLKLSKRKAITGSSVSLRVTVGEAGVLFASGSSVLAVTRRATKAATYSLKISLSAKAKKALAKRKTLKVKTKVAFTATRGLLASKSVTLTFKPAKAKPVRHHDKKGGR